MSKKRVFTNEETELMIDMYEKGYSYSDIGKELKTKGQRVSNYLKELGYGRRSHKVLRSYESYSKSRKNFFNESYFSNINSQDKAYWLGFLYADGCVYKRKDKSGHDKGGSLEISLKREDTYHIRNFLDDISSDIKISKRKVKLNGKEYDASRAIISSVRMVDDLIKHGCVERKSLILQPPNIEEEFIPHFIRGYFDGDGCVAFYPERNAYKYSIIGTFEVLDFIRQKAGVPDNVIINFDHKKCFELIITSKRDIEKFHNYIYKDKIIYLQRKYDKSLAMMKYGYMEDCRSETQKLADLLGDNLYVNCEDTFEAYSYRFNKTERSETAAMADLLD